MRNRVLILTLMFLFAWTFPITKSVQVDVHINKPKVIQTKATWVQKQHNKAMAMRYAKAGWGWDRTQRKCAYLLFMKESRFDHLAKNSKGSSAYGIAQMLKEKSSDPQIQILHAYRYIESRYTTPCRAWYHHQKRNWY